jgi:hypothetical protein
MANGMFKMKMDIDRHGPRLMPNNCQNLDPPRYQLPLKQKLLSQARLEDGLLSVAPWRMFSSNKRVTANRKKGFYTIRLPKNDPSLSLICVPAPPIPRYWAQP